MYKENLALNNLQWLICHKTQPNQTKSYIQPWAKLRSTNEKLKL